VYVNFIFLSDLGGKKLVYKNWAPKIGVKRRKKEADRSKITQNSIY
jgi:hypothetical protein